MKYYPICLDIRGRKCLVIGGGRVAERKVNGLLSSGGMVTVVSPQLNEGLQHLCDQGRVSCISRGYLSGDVEGFFVVIAATDDIEIQKEVYKEAERKGILVNVADVPERCSFILPAQVKRGDLSIAVSTAGKSPALAKKMRQELEEIYGSEYAVLVEVFGAIRPQVLARGLQQKENEIIFNSLLDSDILDWIRKGRLNLIQDLVRERCGCELTEEVWAKIKESC